MQNVFAQNVIARYNDLAMKPMIFFADEIVTGEKIKAYVEDQGVIEVPLSVYKSSKPLSEADTKFVVDQYAKVAKLEPNIRYRLPYTKMQKLVNRLINDPNTPHAEKQVLEVMQRSEERLSKRQIAARQRYASDGVAAALTGIKGIPNDAPPDAKEAAVKELSDKLAKLLMTAL